MVDSLNQMDDRSTTIERRGERLTAIEKMLFRNSQGLRAVEIAKACGVDRRTIYRDLAMLEKIGIPIAQEDGKFLINRDYYLASVRMNFNEAVALFIAARSYARHAEQQNPHVVSALNKLCGALPESLSQHVRYVADWIRSSPIDRNYAQNLETIIRAWVSRHKVKLWGSSGKSGDIYLHEFSTYFLEPGSNGGLYAIGYDEVTQGICTLKVEWIKRTKLLDETYDVPADFDRRPYLESVWSIMGNEGENKTRVVLAFSPDVTSLIRERLWHTSQQLEILDDRRCTLSVTVGDWHDLLPWIRSWGAQVEVLEPAALRNELAGDAARVALMYQPMIARP